MRRLMNWLRLIWIVPLCGLAGCATGGGSDPQREIAALKDTVAKQKNDLTARQASIDELNKQLATCRGLSAEDLKRIFYPEKIVIASLSGGEDYDGKPGDDGVTVYLQPEDRKGDIIKVAGAIRVELYDLANPPGTNQLGIYDFTVDQVVDLWYGQLMTNHFTLRCPWQHGAPKHPEITVRITFVDYLTKRVLAAQTVVKVKESVSG